MSRVGGSRDAWCASEHVVQASEGIEASEGSEGQ